MRADGSVSLSSPLGSHLPILRSASIRTGQSRNLHIRPGAYRTGSTSERRLHKRRMATCGLARPLVCFGSTEQDLLPTCCRSATRLSGMLIIFLAHATEASGLEQREDSHV